MLRSMTGYGRGEVLVNERKVVTEVRSYNHRYLDVSVRISRNFFPLEKDIKKLVAAYAPRGKVEVSIQFESLQESGVNLQVNPTASKHIYGLLQQIQKDIDVPGDVNLETLLPFKDIIFKEAEEDVDEESFWVAMKPSLEQALQAMHQMQIAEGEEISRDMMQRLEDLEAKTGNIETLVPESLALRKQALQERVQALCAGVDVDEARILQEIAILADKSDITEELVRAKSHLKQFMQWLTGQEPVGRKLEFLIQEINREINTMGSKVSDSDIALLVVEIKNEMEKIREQVQNVM